MWITLSAVRRVVVHRDPGQAPCLHVWDGHAIPAEILADEAPSFLDAYCAGRDRRDEALVQLYELLDAAGPAGDLAGVEARILRARHLIEIGRKYEYLEVNRQHLQELAANKGGDQ